MPDWTNRSIEPIEGSKNVVIEHWETGNATSELVRLRDKLEFANNVRKRIKDIADRLVTTL